MPVCTANEAPRSVTWDFATFRYTRFGRDIFDVSQATFIVAVDTDHLVSGAATVAMGQSARVFVRHVVRSIARS